MLSRRDLDGMAATQAAGMLDECELLQRADGAADAYGIPQPTYTVVERTPCGLSHSQVGAEVSGSGRRDTQVPIDLRRLRLPVTAQIDHVDRIRMTRRFGFAITPVLYEVVGDPQRGPSGLLLQVRMVTDE